MKRSTEQLPDIETQKKNLLKRLHCLHGAEVIDYLQQNKTHADNPCVGQYPLGEEYYIESNPAYLFMQEVKGRKRFGVIVTAKNTSGNETVRQLDFDILDAQIDEYDQSLLKTGKHCDAKTNDFHDVFDSVMGCRTYLDVWNLIKEKKIRVSAVNTINVARRNAANQVIGIRTFHVPVFTFVRERINSDDEYSNLQNNRFASQKVLEKIEVEDESDTTCDNDLKLFPVKRYGEWGFTNEKGSIVVPCKWKYAFNFSEGVAYVEDFNNNHFYVNKKGEIVLRSQWPWADAFIEGLARIRNENMKYGFMDKQGKVIIPCEWNYAVRFNSGLALVQNDIGKFGFIDKKGKEVISCHWRMASVFVEELAKVEDDNSRWGYINKFGTLVIPCVWAEANFFSEGLACVREPYVNVIKPGKYGFIDKSGNIVIPFKWKSADSFTEGFALVENDYGKFGYIDKSGNEVISCRWLNAGIFNEGLAYIKDSNGKCGYIDTNGEIVIPCIWNSAENFKNGYARVRYPNGLLTVIDRNGNICD